MKIIHRPIDFTADRDYVLECHCRINYACDTPWARKIPYEQYRSEWFSMKSQIDGFYSYLQETAADVRTIAEIILTDDGHPAGYLWVPFHEDADSGFCFAEIQDIFIGEEFRRLGLARELLLYAENNAKKHGARVIRSGTGCENTASIRLHENMGYYQYRCEFEKEL